MAHLFESKITLNSRYFIKDPRLLPYTLFHELVHLWLYDCFLDPGHTWRFYDKMRLLNRRAFLLIQRFIFISENNQNQNLSCSVLLAASVGF